MTGHLWLKWTLLVWTNALMGIWLSGAFHFRSPEFALGVVCGICAFIPCYVWAESLAIKTNNTQGQKSLWISAIVRAFSQMVIIIDVMAGSIAIQIAKWILPKAILEIEFFEALIYTLITGAILSVLVFCITLILMPFIKSQTNSS